MLNKHVSTTFSTEDRILTDFSRGLISRQKAMHKLGADYSELLDMLAERRLPIPKLSDEEVRREAEKMVAFLDKMGA